jgi:hypothetical protein
MANDSPNSNGLRKPELFVLGFLLLVVLCFVLAALYSWLVAYPIVENTPEHECFVAGSWVMTPDGNRKIETLKVGDDVYCMSDSNRVVAGVVRKAHAAGPSIVNRITIRGGRNPLMVTGNHPIMTRDGWVSAGELKPGDYVATTSGYRMVQECVGGLHVPNVYNLSVSPYPTYIVEGVVVHNKSFGYGPDDWSR